MAVDENVKDINKEIEHHHFQLWWRVQNRLDVIGKLNRDNQSLLAELAEAKGENERLREFNKVCLGTDGTQELQPCQNPSRCINPNCFGMIRFMPCSPPRNGGHMECNTCYCRGPWADTLQAARNAWNAMSRKNYKCETCGDNLLCANSGGVCESVQADHELAEKVREKFCDGYAFVKLPEEWNLMGDSRFSDSVRDGENKPITNIEELLAS